MLEPHIRRTSNASSGLHVVRVRSGRCLTFQVDQTTRSRRDRLSLQQLLSKARFTCFGESLESFNANLDTHTRTSTYCRLGSTPHSKRVETPPLAVRAAAPPPGPHILALVGEYLDLVDSSPQLASHQQPVPRLIVGDAVETSAEILVRGLARFVSHQDLVPLLTLSIDL
jgi:hypothetical protein